MAINTTSATTITRNDLINLALSLIGVSEPQNTDIDLGVKVLNAMIHNLDALGNWLWAIDTTESQLITVASQQSYTTGILTTNISPNILRLEWAAVLKSPTDRTPLTILDKMGSLRTDLKSDSNAEPSACYLQRANLRSANKLFLFPTPNSAYTIVYNFRRPLYDFVLASDNPDFPQEWFLPLQKKLAYELAPHYNKSLNERQLLQAEAEKSFQEVKSSNADKPSYIPLRTEYF